VSIVQSRGLMLLLALLVSLVSTAQAQTEVCPRFAAGGIIEKPPEIHSQHGVLELGLHLRYQQTLSSEGPLRYCLVTDDGVESPTLRVYPGDRLIIHLHNDLPPWRGHGSQTSPGHESEDGDCTGGQMNPSITNLHFHGMSIPPVCHQDDVIHTAVSPGGEFDYRVTIPVDEPPGLYWYHPHPHGFSERQVQGGASGAIIVEGIQKVVPALKSLPERVIVLRDQQYMGSGPSTAPRPAWDISANFVPVTYSGGRPAILKVSSGGRELWRVVNAGADVIFNLQVVIKNTAQRLDVVAIDGVPLSTVKGLTSQDSILLPPGARAEFVLTTPKEGQNSQLVTLAWNTGPQGDNDPQRVIADIVSSASFKRNTVRAETGALWSPVRKMPQATVQRHLYFSQVSTNSEDSDVSVVYYITMVGEAPQPYNMSRPPTIVARRGDVEDWTIENRSPEDHVFHIHQIHFWVVEIDGKPTFDSTMRDTVDVPYWSGKGPYPNVKLRMDFRDPSITGTFLYHCHILRHEDAGMVGAIRVDP
jgi:FtsP/CotA-like multicopper oxidase with cupredoxin domain